MKVPKKTRDLAMKIICEYHANKKPNGFINVDYLCHLGFPEIENAKHVIKVLESMGYLKTGNQLDESAIELTDKGRCYFEIEADNKRDFWRKSILTPIIVSTIANLAISGIKWLWPLIQEWVLNIHH